MSVTLTEQAVVDRRKTETRRLGWLTLQPGAELELCRKVMGRKRRDGSVEPLVRLARVEVTDVRREPLCLITDSAVRREGFTRDELSAYAHLGGGGTWDGSDDTARARFVRFFTASMRCTPDTEVTVITWRYLD